MTHLRAIKVILKLVILVFAGAPAYISYVIYGREAALQHVSRYNIAWLASQATTEYARLEQRISAFSMPGSTVDKDEVQLRLDIVANRLKLLESGQIEELLAAEPDDQATVLALAEVVARVQPLVDRLEQPGAVQQSLDMLRALDIRLARLAASANTFSGRQVAEDQRQLLVMHWAFSSLAAGLVVCGIVLAVFLLGTTSC